MSIQFTITPTTTSIHVKLGHEGKFSFTVTSRAAPGKVYAVLVQALLIGADGTEDEVDWLIVGPQRTLSMSDQKSETITITVKPTDSTLVGSHKVRLAVADKDRPNDDYAFSAPVVCEVSRESIGVIDAKKPKPLPWWLIPAIAGGLLVVGLSAWGIWSLVHTTPPQPPDDGPTSGSWRSDSADDFAAAGYTTSQAEIHSRGAIEPVAYYTGGVLAGASDTGVINKDVTTTWADVQAMPSTGAHAIVRASDIVWNTATPAGVGLSDGDNWTLWFEGEIWLDAGTWTFSYAVDDRGFLDIADAAGTFKRICNARWSAEGQGLFSAVAAGWYPIRWAASDDLGNALAVLRYRGPGAPSTIAVPRHRLRVRADQLAGMVMAGFNGHRFAGDHATTLDRARPADVSWDRGAPRDLGVADELFSVRWSGQLRIDMAGSYQFRYASDDGQRLWVDGKLVLDAWDNVSHTQTSPAITLAPGWHGIVIDQTEFAGQASAVLSVESGPELAGAALPVSRLRAVEGREERYDTGVNHMDITIPDLGSVDSTVALTAPDSATVRGVDVAYAFEHTQGGDLRILLIAPGGKTALLRASGTGGAGSLTERFFRSDLDGAPVAGIWSLRFDDVNSGSTGIVRDFALTVHYGGAGEPPIPPLAFYESPVRDLGKKMAVDRVAWTARQPAGTSVAVTVRTCAAAAACAGAPWSAPLADPAGTKPNVPPGRFVQYRIAMTSTGDAAAALESIQLDYKVPR